MCNLHTTVPGAQFTGILFVFYRKMGKQQEENLGKLFPNNCCLNS